MTNTGMKIVPFDMKYLNDYYNGFNEEITKYQWPDPFSSLDDAKDVLQEFLHETERDETLLFAVVDSDDRLIGSVEMHGLSGNCPELGVWIKESEQGKGYGYQALRYILHYAHEKYGKTEFFYEADVRNTGSTKLLNKLSDVYEINSLAEEKPVTDSGKELILQGSVLKVR